MSDVAEPLSPASGLPVLERARAALRAGSLAAIVARLVLEARADHLPTAAVFAPRAQRTAQAILGVHGVTVRVYGSPPAGPALLAANHVSYLDPLVVSSVAPCISIAKGETSEWPLIGRGLQALGVIFVRRGDAFSGAVVLRRALRALRTGAVVLNFPEGTTSDGRDVSEFRHGCFGLAALAGVPVVPTRIVYDDARVAWYGGQTFMPHYWRLAGVPRLVARVFFGSPLGAERSARPLAPRDVAADLALRARAAVASLGASS
jgi:1-acyl-sn-glycerol-3-phosphate acyltransferase